MPHCPPDPPIWSRQARDSTAVVAADEATAGRPQQQAGDSAAVVAADEATAGGPQQSQIKLVAPLEEIDDWDPDREVSTSVSIIHCLTVHQQLFDACPSTTV
eukprot:1160869-Pelagomonas_calceolata.AAC.8